MPLGELVRLDHGAMPTAMAMQPGALAEPRQHRKMGLLPGVVFGNAMPAHARDGGALRHTWEAARAGGACGYSRLHLDSRYDRNGAIKLNGPY
jgi:hypothetical protein